MNRIMQRRQGQGGTIIFKNNKHLNDSTHTSTTTPMIMMVTTLCILLSLGSTFGTQVMAFAATTSTTRRWGTTTTTSSSSKSNIYTSAALKRVLTIQRAGGNDDNNNSDGRSSNPMKDATELTSTLARLDKQWKIQQSFQSKAQSRWTKLILPKDPNDDVVEEEPSSSSSSTSSFSPLQQDSTDEFVWLLEPPNNVIPSCLIVFTGGAGLGQFPNIAYSELLTRISNRLNAAILATPYQVGLDHFALAKQTGEQIRRARIYCQDDPTRSYPSTIPTYSLGHSLGCKLQTIYMAATGITDYNGIGFMNYNNYSFKQTVAMAKMFAEQLGGMGNDNNNNNQGGQQQQQPFDMRNPFQNEQAFNTLFDFAETVVDMIGVEFSPNSKDTERFIQLKYDDTIQQKTRLFVCDEDNLDTSKEFMENCSGGNNNNIISASGIPGGHLTSVYFKLGLDDLGMDDNNIPDEAREMVQEAMGGFQSASFGDEDHLNALVDEICNWILGKGPSRGPFWDSTARTTKPPQITAAATGGGGGGGT